MSRIKFFALGGLGEDGKNMYICEVDDRIFILDAGLKFPDVDLLGVDNVYPNISYLEQNQSKIVGIFLSHGHEENIGATIEVLKRFNIGVFGSHFTISVLESMITEANLDLSIYRLYRINEGKVLNFGPITVEFYNVCHSIPDTLNIAITTSDGVIVYAPDFTFDIANDRKYHVSFDKITNLGEKGVLMVASGSEGVNNVTRTHNNVSLENTVSQLVMKEKRVFISMYSTDLVRLQRVIDICLSYNKRIAIIGRKTQKLISVAINLGYLNVPEERLVNLKFRTEDNPNTDDDLVVIVTGVRHEPYFSIQRMCRGVDKLVKIEKGDEVLFIAPPQLGCERIASKTLDELLMKGAKCYSMKEEELRSSHADSEELKMLYTMLKPKYIIPINGEYRHQYVHRAIASQVGYNEQNCLIIENGDVVLFEDKEFKGVIDHVTCGDVLVDGATVGDVNDVVLKDRELLSEDGIIIVAALINKDKKMLYDGPTLRFSGVITEIANQFIDELKMETEKFLKAYFRMILDENSPSCNELLRDDLMKFMFEKTIIRPLIIPSIIEINE